MTHPPQLAAAIAPLSSAVAQDSRAASPRRAAPVGRGGLLHATGWLPPAMRTVDPDRYRRHLLHEAPDGAFSIGCFVWDRGQQTPIHDHHGWGLAGVAEGALLEE